MSLTIELPPDIEKHLAEVASDAGMSPESLAGAVLQSAVAPTAELRAVVIDSGVLVSFSQAGEGDQFLALLRELVARLSREALGSLERQGEVPALPSDEDVTDAAAREVSRTTGPARGERPVFVLRVSDTGSDGKSEDEICTPGSAAERERRSEQNRAASSLLREWLAEEPTEEDNRWPELQEALEESHSSHRRLFGE